MYYTAQGKGKTIVLVHGFGEEGMMWKPLSDKLTEKYRVIIPDLPGFGQSPLTRKTISMSYYADCIAQMLEAEKVKTCVMLGHSMGGYTTLEFARRYGDKLRGFGLINSQCYTDSEQRIANREKSIAFIEKNGSEPFINELYVAIFHPDFAAKHKTVVDKLRKAATQYKPEALAAATRAMINRKDTSSVLKKAPFPVLIISGREDQTIPFENTLNQASLAARTHFYLLDNSKHMSIYEQKSTVLKAVLNYLESL